MNLKYWLQRAIGRAPCQLETGAKLHARARLFNIARDAHRIHIGARSIVLGELLVFHQGQITLGQWCYVGEGTRIWSAGNIKIGNRVLISHNVNIFDNLTHPLGPTERHRQFRAIATTGHPRDVDLRPNSVSIGDDVLVSCNAIILPGVILGTGSVVGAGAVVTHDVPPYTVVAGNPARIIRELDPDERK